MKAEHSNGNEGMFTLYREDQGFVYKNHFYSTQIKGDYKLTLIQYFSIQHLYDSPERKIYSKDLKPLVEDSRAFRSSKCQEQTPSTSGSVEDSRSFSSGKCQEQTLSTSWSVEDSLVQSTSGNSEIDKVAINIESNIAQEGKTDLDRALDQIFSGEPDSIIIPENITDIDKRLSPKVLAELIEDLTEEKSKAKLKVKSKPASENKQEEAVKQEDWDVSYANYRSMEEAIGKKKPMSRKQFAKAIAKIDLDRKSEDKELAYFTSGRSNKNPNTHYKKKESILRNGNRISTIPGSISSYFIKCKKIPVANLFGSLIQSSGKSGYYSLIF